MLLSEINTSIKYLFVFDMQKIFITRFQQERRHISSFFFHVQV